MPCTPVTAFHLIISKHFLDNYIILTAPGDERNVMFTVRQIHRYWQARAKIIKHEGLNTAIWSPVYFSKCEVYVCHWLYRNQKMARRFEK